jgi:glycosyltransferase involved in cell wall biosynthesis
LRLGWRSDRGWLRHIAYLAEACTLLGWLEGSGAHHLHAHFGTNPTEVGLLCRVLGGPPYSFTAHGPEEFDKPAALALPTKLARAAFAIGVSKFGRSQLLRWCSHDVWPRIHVVRCIVDGSFRSGRRPASSAARFVCVGRLCEQKGHLILLEAFRTLLDRGIDAELVLLGDGPSRSTIERRVAQLRLDANVRMLGWADEPRVRDEILAARALVAPSLAEGLPVVLMEAMALGCPVISTHVAGIPELVESGREGWLVPAGSVADLADAMAEAMNASPSLLCAMGEAGRAKVAKLHCAGDEGAKLARLFSAPP